MSKSQTKKGISQIFLGVLLYAINLVVTNSTFIVAMGNFYEIEDAYLVIDSITDVIGIVAIVLIIMGALKAKKECKTFRFIIPLIALGVLCSIAVDLSRDLYAYQVTWIMCLDIVSTIFNCLFVLCLCIGLRKLYKKNKNDKRAKKAIVVLVLYIIFSVIAVLLMQFATIFSGHLWNSELFEMLIIAWASVLLNIVSNLIVILYLSQAKNELGK